MAKEETEKELFQEKIMWRFNHYIEVFIRKLLEEQKGCNTRIHYRNGIRHILEQDLVFWVEYNYPNIFKEWELHLRNKLNSKTQTTEATPPETNTSYSVH